MDFIQQKELMNDVEDMDISELDLEGIEKSCSEKDKGYVTQEQVSLLKEAILKAKFSNYLGINLGSIKETKKKQKSVGKNLAKNQINRKCRCRDEAG